MNEKWRICEQILNYFINKVLNHGQLGFNYESYINLSIVDLMFVKTINKIDSLKLNYLKC